MINCALYWYSSNHRKFHNGELSLILEISLLYTFNLSLQCLHSVFEILNIFCSWPTSNHPIMFLISWQGIFFCKNLFRLFLSIIVNVWIYLFISFFLKPWIRVEINPLCSSSFTKKIFKIHERILNLFIINYSSDTQYWEIEYVYL